VQAELPVIKGDRRRSPEQVEVRGAVGELVGGGKGRIERDDILELAIPWGGWGGEGGGGGWGGGGGGVGGGFKQSISSKKRSFNTVRPWGSKGRSKRFKGVS